MSTTSFFLSKFHWYQFFLSLFQRTAHFIVRGASVVLGLAYSTYSLILRMPLTDET
jgi:hypothetical protein